MLLKARVVKTQLFLTGMLPVLWAVSGCELKSAELPTYMRPDLLYLNDQPCSSLYVEVDSVEGVEVPRQWLDELGKLLTRYCSKPGGIKIIQDEPVPLSLVKGLPVGAASILCLDGPDPNSGSQSAYLHIFFYDRNVGIKSDMKLPHVPTLCPSGIFINLSYFQESNGKLEEFALKHELGHVLGLCRNRVHGDGVHCSTRQCLMYRGVSELSTVGFSLKARMQAPFCGLCQIDLRRRDRKATDPKLSFKGPFLIRREDGYAIASLPYSEMIIPADLESIDWAGFLAWLKGCAYNTGRGDSKEGRKPRGRQWYLTGHWYEPPETDGVSEKPSDFTALLRRAADDPSPAVKTHVAAVLKQLEQERDE